MPVEPHLTSRETGNMDIMPTAGRALLQHRKPEGARHQDVGLRQSGQDLQRVGQVEKVIRYHVMQPIPARNPDMLHAIDYLAIGETGIRARNVADFVASAGEFLA